MANFKKLEVWEKAHALSLFSHDVALGIRGAMYASLAGRDIGVVSKEDFVSLSSQAKTVRMMLYGLLKRLDK
jgi:hypothetical protein